MASASCLNPDDVIEATYGSGRYQLRVLLLLGGICVMTFPTVQLQVFVGPKMASDDTIPTFTREVVRATETLLFVGWSVGSLVTGFLVDKLGRWSVTYVLTTAIVGSYVCCVLAANANMVSLYSAFMLVAGFCLPHSVTAYVYMSEAMPSKRRVTFTCLVNVTYSACVGLMSLLCGHVTRHLDWRYETLLFMSPLALLLLGAPLLHESLHVLVMRGQTDAAERVASAIAKTNGAAQQLPTLQPACNPRVEQLLSDGSLESDQVDCRQHSNATNSDTTPACATAAPAALSPLRELLQAPLRTRLALATVCWIAATLGYFGLSFAAGNLSPDLYQNMFFFSLADVAGYLLPTPLVPRLGRRLFQALVFASAAVALLACAVVPREMSWLLVLCSVAGRMFIDMAFATCYMITVEAFPTGCRTTAMGVTNAVARMLSLTAPLMSKYPANVACPIFGSMCALAAAATLALPETGNWRLSQVC